MTHLRIERNPTIVRKAKTHWLKRDPLLPCTCCRASFLTRYGQRGRGFIEAHHRKPLQNLEHHETVVTKIADLAPVCSNCHRMLHREPLLTIEDLTAYFDLCIN